MENVFSFLDEIYVIFMFKNKEKTITHKNFYGHVTCTFIKSSVTVCCHRKFPEAFFDISLLFKVSRRI